MRLDDTEFRALLDLFMCSDPYPIAKTPHKQWNGEVLIQKLLNSESEKRGYRDWRHAYRDFQ